ncbi:hypothetical protein JHK82_023631 [Glycine max]|nr:hypothetical protein JHK85_024189 [Glycine max]KAG5011434.1 hypothetical protein JHK86_023695 [Glycine max]KAG5132443.1 hypothetical protein JHK82_023631 [Glycine max]
MSFWDNNNNNSHELQSQNQLPVVQSKGGSKMGSLAKKGLNNYGQTAPATPFENQGNRCRGAISNQRYCVSETYWDTETSIKTSSSQSGQPWVNVKAKDKKDYPSVQYTAWTTSPVVGWINHKFLPLHFRVVFQSLAAFFCGNRVTTHRSIPASTKKPSSQSLNQLTPVKFCRDPHTGTTQIHQKSCFEETYDSGGPDMNIKKCLNEECEARRVNA